MKQINLLTSNEKNIIDETKLLFLIFVLVFVIVVLSAPLLGNRDDCRTRKLSGQLARAKPFAARTKVCRIVFLFSREGLVLQNLFPFAQSFD
jgi:hypothetical protein